MNEEQQRVDIGKLKEDVGTCKSDIRLLEHNVISADKKIAIMEDRYEQMNDLNTAISVMSLTLDHIVEHNTRQDNQRENDLKMVAEERESHIQALAEQREHNTKNMEAITETLGKMNKNLTQLTQGQEHLNNKMGSLNSKVELLEDRVEQSEKKSMIDLRDLEKEEKMGVLRKYGMPVGVGVGIGTTLAMIILEIIKAFNS